ncbi:GlxA family transcriptional regulator [Streptomyces cyanogenus]|uniref:HTH-type transcriptional regulator CdhR n=1 Tax=Streptomyces cyanogenus TaxID=80860 RepID=A0ABX7TKI3_STRCY|nr:helix-turn-helix domain-containing protein [Streptomyces cyanogenus]QTD95880.1 HTH-type transcriptional regulator CdhR [Streptomyces cyanogenus]
MKVAVLVLDDVFDSGLTSVLDVLQTANELRTELPHPPPPWDVDLVGVREAPVRTGAGLVVQTTAADRCGASLPDVLVVPGITHKQPEPLLTWTAAEAQQPARELLCRYRAEDVPVAAACTATFLLAESGILNDLQATTSWWLAPYFRRRYPQVRLDDTHMLIRAEGVTTAGAAFAHLDLALALVQQRSPALAELTARYLVIDSRPTQSAYAIPSHLARTDPLVDAFERWLRTHLDQPLSIADTARALGSSERTLQRACDRVLGISPVQFAQEIRLEQAIHLLRTTELSTEAVARRVGYHNATTLTTLLRRRHTSPGRLRRPAASLTSEP